MDIFSFGMFLYELLMLKMPFEGQDFAALGNIKGYVLSGGRPAISDHVRLVINYIYNIIIMSFQYKENIGTWGKIIYKISIFTVKAVLLVFCSSSLYPHGVRYGICFCLMHDLVGHFQLFSQYLY